jgi:ssDNA-binding replication factor A large subunit
LEAVAGLNMDEAGAISIAELEPMLRPSMIVFKVLDISEPRNVRVRRTGLIHRVAEATVADSSGRIMLTLWDSDIDEVAVGKTYALRNGRINLRDESMSLARGFSGEFVLAPEPITQVSDSPDMSRPFAGVKIKQRRDESGTGRNFQGRMGREARGFCSKKSF